MVGLNFRSILAFLDRARDKRNKQQPAPTPSNLRLVLRCETLANSVQEKLHLKYNPLEASLIFIKTTHPNIVDMTKFLKRVNAELSKKNPQLLSSDFPYDLMEIPLDAFFISTAGNYISQNAIGDFVVETSTMLGFVKDLAQAEAGDDEYRFRMLLKTVSSLTSIHGAISTVLAE